MKTMLYGTGTAIGTMELSTFVLCHLRFRFSDCGDKMGFQGGFF